MQTDKAREQACENGCCKAAYLWWNSYQEFKMWGRIFFHNAPDNSLMRMGAFFTFLARPKFVSIIHKLAGEDYPLLVSMTSPCCFFIKSLYTILRREQREVHPSACWHMVHELVVPWPWASRGAWAMFFPQVSSGSFFPCFASLVTLFSVTQRSTAVQELVLRIALA